MAIENTNLKRLIFLGTLENVNESITCVPSHEPDGQESELCAEDRFDRSPKQRRPGGTMRKRQQKAKEYY
jgi:hypothetical protein